MKRITKLTTLTIAISVFLPLAIQSIANRKVFNWNGSITRMGDKITIDSTYKLYIRRICRAADSTREMPFGTSVRRFPCDAIAHADVLTEIQHIYYSKAKGRIVVITYIPNYPRYENGPPAYNRPQIRNSPTVNLWHANAFLFGRTNASQAEVSFLHWKDAKGKARYTKWRIAVSTDESTISITHIRDPDKKGDKDYWVSVDSNLGVGVVYRASPIYPCLMNVDGTMLDTSYESCSLKQVFYYKNLVNGYELLIPYNHCRKDSVDKDDAMSFEGKKSWGSRLPFDPTPCFDGK